MRTLRRGVMSVVGVAALVGMLAGCADTSTEPVETSASAPVESAVETAPELTDEEALQIAVETYEEYLAIGGEVIDTQGAAYDKLAAITTENMTALNEETLHIATSNQYSTDGTIPVVKSELIRADSSMIEALICTDLSHSQTFDLDGNPVGPDREGITNTLKIRVVQVEGMFKIDGSDVWAQSDFCAE